MWQILLKYTSMQWSMRVREKESERQSRLMMFVLVAPPLQTIMALLPFYLKARDFAPPL